MESVTPMSGSKWDTPVGRNPCSGQEKGDGRVGGKGADAKKRNDENLQHHRTNTVATGLRKNVRKIKRSNATGGSP